MDSNKYQGTMYCHCNSTLTDRMKEADMLVKNLEYIYEHIDKSQLSAYEGLLNDVEAELMTRCVTPRFHLTQFISSSTDELFKHIIYHVKAVFQQIYTAWIAGVPGYTPIFSECMTDVSQKINSELAFQRVLSRRESTWRGRK